MSGRAGTHGFMCQEIDVAPGADFTGVLGRVPRHQVRLPLGKFSTYY